MVEAAPPSCLLAIGFAPEDGQDRLDESPRVHPGPVPDGLLSVIVDRLEAPVPCEVEAGSMPFGPSQTTSSAVHAWGRRVGGEGFAVDVTVGCAHRFHHRYLQQPRLCLKCSVRFPSDLDRAR